MDSDLWIIRTRAYHQYGVGFAPGFLNYKKWCTRLAAASDKVYQLLAHARWFSPVTPASSTTKTGRHDITEVLLKVALSTIKQTNMIRTRTKNDNHYNIEMVNISAFDE